MKHYKKVTAVLLSIVLGLSCFGIFAFAETEKEKSASDLAFENLEKDVPLILVVGLGGQYYSGIQTETEDDDVQIWEPTMDMISPVISNYGFDLIKAVLKKDYVEVNAIIKDVAQELFGQFALDDNGKPNPDTGKKEDCTRELQTPNGYDKDYTFTFDWRYDVVTLADQLDAYVQYVMELTGTDKVAFAATSMGSSVLMTYLYKHFYTNENYAETNHIQSAVFICGTMNGAATCQDPFSANMSMDAESIVRYIEGITGGEIQILRALYSMGIFEPVLNYVSTLVQGVIDNGLFDSIEDTLATIPGFHALMSSEHYTLARNLIYDTSEKQERFATILEASDYFHYTVQPNNAKIIQKMIDSGINTAIFAEYGYNLMPATSDNDRLSDGTIALADASFGATHTDVDTTFPADYVQTVACSCGKNHISPDRQIDASTCAFADITWFGKDMFHIFDDELLEKLVDLVTYSEEQISVHTYEDLPQFMIRKGDSLVPLTEDNFGEIIEIEKSIENDEETAKLVKNIKLIIAAVVIVLVALTGLIVFGIVRCAKKRKAKKAK